MGLPTIYIDNDETIQTSSWLSHPITDPRISCVNYPQINADCSYLASYVRPGILETLQLLRKTYKVRMLTMGTRAYSELINKQNNLGFSSSDIIAKEDYVGMGYSSCPIAFVQDQDPNSILIDDMEDYSDFAHAKCKYLGIKKDRYIRINALYMDLNPNTVAEDLQISASLPDLISERIKLLGRKPSNVDLSR